MRKFWKSWRFKNLSILCLSILIAFFVFRYEPIHQVLLHLGTLGYVGAFIGGILFVSTFTVATGAIILLILAETLSPLEIGIVAGLGAVMGDFTIFRIFQDDLQKELEIIYNNVGGGHFTKVVHTRYFSWTLPVVGALLIASPLPDEIGISLMGISKLKSYQFLLISFFLNAVGIFLAILASTVIKP